MRGNATIDSGDSAHAKNAISDRALSSVYAKLHFGDDQIRDGQERHYESTAATQAQRDFVYGDVDAGFVNMSELEVEAARR